MTRNIIQTMTKLNVVKQVSESCLIKPEDLLDRKALLSIRSTSVIDTQHSEKRFVMF